MKMQEKATIPSWETIIGNFLREFYWKRLRRVTILTIRGLMRKEKVYLLVARSGHSASQIVDRMLRDYVASSGESSSVSSFWREVTGEPGFHVALLDMMMDDSQFAFELAAVSNRLTREFLNGFYLDNGSIDWPKLVEFNSGNYDLDRFLP